MSAPSHQPLSSSRIYSCVLINLCATPGLGSLMARRVLAGVGQLLLAIVGFILIVGWMLEFFFRIFLEQLDRPLPPKPAGWMWLGGLIFFAAGWLWSLVTSVSLLRQAKMDERRNPVPPRLTS